MPGGGGVLQRRVEELEGTVRKLDEERRQLKQENASLVSNRLYSSKDKYMYVCSMCVCVVICRGRQQLKKEVREMEKEQKRS